MYIHEELRRIYKAVKEASGSKWERESYQRISCRANALKHAADTDMPRSQDGKTENIFPTAPRLAEISRSVESGREKKKIGRDGG